MTSPAQSDALLLHIDPDDARRGVRSQVLRTDGIEVIEAADGASGLALIGSRQPDLVLLHTNAASAGIGSVIKAHWPEAFVIKTANGAADPNADSTADVILPIPLEPPDLVAVTRVMLRLRSAEIDARAMAERLRVSVENAEDCAILTCCPDGFITSWNHGAEVIFGYGKHEIVGQPYASLIAGDDGGGTLLQAMQAARLEPHVRSERWHQRRDGSRFWAHGRMAPLHDRAGAIAGYIEILHDRSAERQSREALEAMNAELEQRIAERTAELAAANERLVAEMAERERTEVQLRQAQKIEALGHLTGGIAHDFNNLLTAIMGGLEVIRMRTQDPRTLRLIDSSMNAAARGASLITQLRAFAGRQRLNTEVVALNTLVGDMREQLNGIAGHTVVISLALDPGAWPVLADPEQVRVALVNLTANARETMTGGGSLHIATGNESVGPATATPSLAPGDYGTLAVRDDGQGMTEEAMARLFEPFFTTKDVGKGSGLGLAQVYGFVRQSGGDIRVVSHPGQGTSLTLLLPRAVEPAPGPAGHPAPSQDP